MQAMGVEAIASAMTTHLSEPMLQLAALMTFIPLAVGNPMMQASITQGALSQILTGLSTHRGIPPIQDKGMVLLGVLMQGDEPTLVSEAGSAHCMHHDDRAAFTCMAVASSACSFGPLWTSVLRAFLRACRSLSAGCYPDVPA